MTTYADPTRCPDCRAVLPHDPQVCRICSLPLTGETAFSLFRTLQEADRLLAVLREQKAPVTVTATSAPASGSLLDGVEPYPSATGRPVPATAAPRLRGTSVPQILLSLGAVCLLVAAVTFLAVAWQWLGVSGRTIVLVALTGASLGLSVTLLRRGLRTAAESLSVVGLGLLAIDVVGARHAGWLGPATEARTTMLAGVVVATVALLLLLVTSSHPLVAPGIAAPVATFVAGVASVSDVDSMLRLVVTCTALLALGRVGTLLRLRAMVVVSLVAGGLTWAALVADAFTTALDDSLTVAHLWGGADAWPLVAATVLMASAGPVVGLGRMPTSTCYGLAGLLGSYVVAAPALDNGSTAAATSLVALVGLWSLALALVPRRSLEAAIPLLGTVVFPVVCTVELFISSASAVLTVGSPFTQSFGVHVADVYVDPSRWLLTPLLVVLSLAVCAVLRSLATPTRRTCVMIVATAAAVGVVASLPLYDVPLALVVGVLLAIAVGCFVAAERLPANADVARLAGLVLVTGDALLALPSDRMVVGVLVVACAIAGYLMARIDATGAAAAFCFPIAFAGLVWSGGEVLGVDGQFRAVPVLLVLGALAIWRPQLELEASSALVGTLVSAVSVLLADDLSVSLAVHLTIAGVMVTALSIVHPSRRLLAWPGGLLLAVATWVRLADLGVHVPEAYTLPSALVLVAVGAWRLDRDDRSATLTVLAPGLALATVPSLVAMLDDPYSLRALLLGIACLVLLLAGAALRWSAPVVVGAVVGVLLVLRELAPYAAHVPTWLSIGAAGFALLVVGITWESRMKDVRRASHYVAALR